MCVFQLCGDATTLYRSHGRRRSASTCRAGWALGPCWVDLAQSPSTESASGASKRQSSLPSGLSMIFVDWPNGYQVQTNRRSEKAWSFGQREACGEEREASLSEAGPEGLGDQVARSIAPGAGAGRATAPTAGPIEAGLRQIGETRVGQITGCALCLATTPTGPPSGDASVEARHLGRVAGALGVR